MNKINSPDKFRNALLGRDLVALDVWSGSDTKLRFRCLSCGNVWSATPNNVLRGRGCPPCRRLSGARSRRKSNKVLHDGGSWLLVDIAGPKHPEATMRISITDWAWLRGEGRVSVGANGYPAARIDGATQRVHRALLPGIREVDHINGDITDNRRSNLRACTRSQNSMNAAVRSNNTSGVTGVSWSRSAKKWHAYLCVEGTRMLSEYHGSRRDAIAARIKAEEKHFGEYRRKDRSTNGK